MVLDPVGYERLAAMDAWAADQERRQRQDMRAAGISIGSPVPGTMEPQIPYVASPTASDYDYAARDSNWVDSSTLPIEEVD
jgi:hypothetical protein